MAAGPPDDFYALLGIAPDADDTQLRRAWRRLALRWHPDRTGPGVATSTFQKIAAAYSVLSDPAARAAYDRRCATAGRSPAPRPPDAASAPTAAGRRRAPADMIWRLSLSLDELIACGFARRAEADVIELFLEPHEATDGGMVTVSMNVPIRCPACSADAAAPCSRCGTKRTVEERFSAWLAIPPAVAEGTVLAPSAQLRGMARPVKFRVRFADPT